MWFSINLLFIGREVLIEKDLYSRSKAQPFFPDGPKSVNNVFISFCCFALFSFSANDAEKIPERGSYRIKD